MTRPKRVLTATEIKEGNRHYEDCALYQFIKARQKVIFVPLIRRVKEILAR
ncbi:MAG: hypothetical protein KAS32_07700 [Candidatus Peribacteraceae bacterium]|nr:hypothetical protein [Candidatus Peribacteraceae bacterium]